MSTAIIVLTAISGGLGALTAVLLGWPGDLVPQTYLLVCAAADAFLSAVVVVLVRSLPLLPPRDDEGKFTHAP